MGLLNPKKLFETGRWAPHSLDIYCVVLKKKNMKPTENNLLSQYLSSLVMRCCLNNVIWKTISEEVRFELEGLYSRDSPKSETNSMF